MSTPNEDDKSSTSGTELSLQESFSTVNVMERLTSKDSVGVFDGGAGGEIEELVES